MSRPLLELRGFAATFVSAAGERVEAVRDIDLKILPGRIHGLVGESGSGKSTLAKSILGLFPPRRIEWRGKVVFSGENLLGASASRLREIRGKEIAYIPQDAGSALNPYQRVGSQVLESLRAHFSVSRDEAIERAEESLRQAGLPDGGDILERFPHQLSAGMAQRVLIAMALSLQPRLLLADEPTSALDLAHAVRIADLLKRLNRRLGLTTLFITHDFQMLRRAAEEVTVLHRGRVVERGTAEAVSQRPRHPITQALVEAHSVGKESAANAEKRRDSAPDCRS